MPQGETRRRTLGVCDASQLGQRVCLDLAIAANEKRQHSLRSLGEREGNATFSPSQFALLFGELISFSPSASPADVLGCRLDLRLSPVLLAVWNDYNIIQ